MSKISELSDGGSLVSTDYLIAVRSGGNVKVKMDQINVDQVDLGDNEFIRLGNSQDLTMVHTSTQSIINQAGIGDLLLQKAGATKLTINASGIDVTGSVTADGLTVDGAADINGDLEVGSGGTGTKAIVIAGSGSSTSVMDLKMFGGGTGNPTSILRHSSATKDFSILTGNSGAELTRLLVTEGGDISFYEDTGTTPKFFWDASAESLGIGTASPAVALDVNGATNTQLRLTASDSLGASIINFGDQANAAVGRIVYSHINDSLSFKTNNVNDRLVVDSSGNVGIGVVPEAWHASWKALQIGPIGFVGSYQAGTTDITALGNNVYSDGAYKYIEADEAVIYKQQNGQHIFEVAPSGTADAAISWTTAMTVDNSGNLLVGKTAVSFATAGIELKGSNVISITRSAGTALNANRIGSSAGSLIIMHYDSIDVGSIDVTASATSYTTSSDQRLKENIADADDAGAKIDAIQVRKFDWKVDGSHQDYGMVAQELMTVAPEAVSQGETEDDMMGVDYSKLVPMMLKEIQSLRARIAALES